MNEEAFSPEQCVSDHRYTYGECLRNGCEDVSCCSTIFETSDTNNYRSYQNDLRYYGSCVSAVAIRTEEPNLCETEGLENNKRIDCYINYAWEYKNTQVCEALSNDPENYLECFIEALDLENVEACLSLVGQEFQDACVLKYVSINREQQDYCRFIESTELKTECVDGFLFDPGILYGFKSVDIFFSGLIFLVLSGVAIWFTKRKIKNANLIWILPATWLLLRGFVCLMELKTQKIIEGIGLISFLPFLRPMDILICKLRWLFDFNWQFYLVSDILTVLVLGGLIFVYKKYNIKKRWLILLCLLLSMPSILLFLYELLEAYVLSTV